MYHEETGFKKKKTYEEMVQFSYFVFTFRVLVFEFIFNTIYR